LNRNAIPLSSKIYWPGLERPANPPGQLQQIKECRARHERLGLPQKYLDGLDHFLRDAASLIPANAAPVILTGEYNPENIFLEDHSGHWRLAALIDFGDVMTGG
jgi:hygromycin-B 7''-O-kinase